MITLQINRSKDELLAEARNADKPTSKKLSMYEEIEGLHNNKTSLADFMPTNTPKSIKKIAKATKIGGFVTDIKNPEMNAIYIEGYESTGVFLRFQTGAIVEAIIFNTPEELDTLLDPYWELQDDD